jgi:aspartate aminotransferase
MEGLDYGPNEILVASGGRPLIYAVFRAICDKGDKIIYALPSWNNNHYTHFVGGEHVEVEAKLENNFMPSAADIRPDVKDATLIALCSPQNPTGTTFRKTELEAICDLILEENKRRGENEKKLYLMYDQMYWHLTYGDIKHYDPVNLRPAMREYTIYIDAISKVFASTGVRVGWSMGPSTVMTKMKAILTHVGAWAPMAEQKAVAKFLFQREAIKKFLAHFRSEIEQRLREIYNGFMKLRSQGFSVDAIAPEAAIYLTIKIDLAGKTTGDGKLLADQSDVTAYLLNEASLAVVPFYAFGASRDHGRDLRAGRQERVRLEHELARASQLRTDRGASLGNHPAANVETLLRVEGLAVPRQHLRSHVDLSRHAVVRSRRGQGRAVLD